MARTCSRSLAEPQHNRTAEPQYVLSLSPSFILLISCHAGLSNKIRDKQADGSGRPSEARRCCTKSEVELKGSEAAAHSTGRAFVTRNFSLNTFLFFFSSPELKQFVICIMRILDLFFKKLTAHTGASCSHSCIY